MKEVEITCTWESVHRIEVPDDWEVPDTLNGFPPEALEQIKSDTAALTDWR